MTVATMLRGIAGHVQFFFWLFGAELFDAVSEVAFAYEKGHIFIDTDHQNRCLLHHILLGTSAGHVRL